MAEAVGSMAEAVGSTAEAGVVFGAAQVGCAVVGTAAVGFGGRRPGMAAAFTAVHRQRLEASAAVRRQDLTPALIQGRATVIAILMATLLPARGPAARIVE